MPPRWRRALSIPAALTAQAATVAPLAADSAAATVAKTAVPAEGATLKPELGGTEPFGPMTAFSSGEVQKARLETSYGKEGSARKRSTPLWWLPVGAGVGVAAVVAWTVLDSSAGPPAAVEVPAVTAEPAAAKDPREGAANPEPKPAPEPEPARAPDPEPEPVATAEAEPDAAVEEIPAKARGKKSARGKKKRSEKGKAPAADPPKPPRADPPPKPPPKKVERDPKNWRVDG